MSKYTDMYNCIDLDSASGHSGTICDSNFTLYKTYVLFNRTGPRAKVENFGGEKLNCAKYVPRLKFVECVNFTQYAPRPN